MTESERSGDQGKKEDERVYDWWVETRKDRAAMARLRRCRRPLDALMSPAALSLLARFSNRHRGRRAESVAALAAVLGHVRESDAALTIARTIGRDSFNDEDSAALSEGRFRRLMQADDPEELQRAMTRLVRFMGQRVNVSDLAESMLWWNDRTKRRWIFDYYAVAMAAPEAPPQADDAEASDSVPA